MQLSPILNNMHVYCTLKAILILNGLFSHLYAHTRAQTHESDPTLRSTYIVMQNFNTTFDRALVLALALASTVSGILLETQATALVEGVNYFVSVYEYE